MKPYLCIWLAMAVLLLLIPLPVLSGGPHAANPPAVPPAEDSSAPPGDLAGEGVQAVFRIRTDSGVVELTERDFLIRTLAFEMSPTDHAEALKAQAVAAYTYYSRRRELQAQKPDKALGDADFAAPKDTFPDLFSPEQLQERWGDQYEKNYRKLCEAVDAVAGKTITYDGKLIDACYFSVSWGSTESAAVVWGDDIPYLQPVPSPGDRLAPNYTSTVTLTAGQVKEAIEKADKSIRLPEDPAQWFGAPVLSDAGSVVTLPVGDGKMTGRALRTALSLRSAAFDVAYTDGQFRFTVRGHGHGVGMSQYGADYLARQGYTWEEILHYYYTDVTVE